MQSNIRDLVQNWEDYRDCRAFVEIKLSGENDYSAYVIAGVSEIVGCAASVYCISLDGTKRFSQILDGAYPVYLIVL